jgi:hypothetical protein
MAPKTVVVDYLPTQQESLSSSSMSFIYYKSAARETLGKEVAAAAETFRMSRNLAKHMVMYCTAQHIFAIILLDY